MWSQNLRLPNLRKMITWTLCSPNPQPCGMSDLTEQIHTGTGKLKMTSVLQGSPYKSPLLRANFLSVSFYSSSSFFNCSFFFFFFAQAWWYWMDFPPAFYARLERRKKLCSSHQGTWTDPPSECSACRHSSSLWLRSTSGKLCEIQTLPAM